MLTEMLKYLDEKFAKGRALTYVNTETHDPSKALVYDHQRGEVIEIPRRPQPRAHTVTTLNSLTAAFREFTENLAAHSVWVADDRVVCLLMGEGGYRDGTITLPLERSDLFETVAHLPSDPKQLLRVVRHDLKSAKFSPDTFEMDLSALQWETVDKASNEIGVVKSTMGRQVTAELKSPRFPEYVWIAFNPYPSLVGYAAPLVSVQCSVFIDVEQRRVHVQPLPGEIERATAQAVSDLASEIRNKLDVDSVFEGSP